jgi:aquaporin Z
MKAVYLFEGLELAAFMISACAFTVLLSGPSAPLLHQLPNPVFRRLLLGAAMGLTAVLIIRSPMGKRSGAHFNPAITLTYLRLGTMAFPDACFYVIAQFVGGALGVAMAALLLGPAIRKPAVMFAVTVPGMYGTTGAFAAEAFMAALLMAVVLWCSNRPSLAARTSYLVGILITFYVLLFAPVSGFSINPARTTASALFADIWSAVWVYFTAPVLGMLLSAELYVRFQGKQHPVLCAKLHPDPAYECPFVSCRFPGHYHRESPRKNQLKRARSR